MVCFKRIKRALNVITKQKIIEMFKHSYFVVLSIKCGHSFHFSPFGLCLLFFSSFFFIFSLGGWCTFTFYTLCCLFFAEQLLCVRVWTFCLSPTSHFNLSFWCILQHSTATVKWNGMENETKECLKMREQILAIYVNWVLSRKQRKEWEIKWKGTAALWLP